MKIGDVEYTRNVSLIQAVVQESAIVDLSFAVGIKVRALLTRVDAFNSTAQAITGGQSCYFENSQSIGPGATQGELRDNPNMLPLHVTDYALSTNGMGIARSNTTLWWKILMPEIRIHIVGTTLAATRYELTLHYRFAELTDDEIVEIAAQRSSG